MDISFKKFESVLSVTGSSVKAAEHTFLPIVLYHSRWNEIQMHEITYYYYYFQDSTYINRGYVGKDKVVPVKMEYLNGDSDSFIIAEENINAINKIHKICAEKGIDIRFFKVPSPFWKQSYSKALKKYLKEQDWFFGDFNDELNEIGIDGRTDFWDTMHMNTNGAKKFTDYLGERLLKLENNFN